MIGLAAPDYRRQHGLRIGRPFDNGKEQFRLQSGIDGIIRKRRLQRSVDHQQRKLLVLGRKAHIPTMFCHIHHQVAKGVSFKDLDRKTT